MSVFLSYNKADRQFAERLSRNLIEDGVQVWLDRWDLRAGESIPTAISSALQKASAFVVVMTPSSMKSSWVKEELASAITRRLKKSPTFIVPVLKKRCRVPALLEHVKYIDFTGPSYSRPYRELKSTLLGLSQKPLLGSPQLPPREAWQYLRWEVDVRIANDQGDAEYQTSVVLRNSSTKSLSISSMHSVWSSTAAGIKLKDIRAYDETGALCIDEHLSQVTGSYTGFRVRRGRPVRPRELWRYWFEMSWPRGFPDLLEGSNYTYKGEVDVHEMIIRVVIPSTLTFAGPVLLRSGDAREEPIERVRVHGREAFVVWRSNVRSGETLDAKFRLKRRRARRSIARNRPD